MSFGKFSFYTTFNEKQSNGPDVECCITFHDVDKGKKNTLKSKNESEESQTLI